MQMKVVKQMKTVSMLVLMSMLTVAAQAIVIDDFNDNDVSDYVKVVMLDTGDGAVHNVSALEAVGGEVQVTTDVYYDIEQTAYIKPGYLLEVGQEVQLDFAHNLGDRAMGIFVGLVPTDNVRANYINVYSNEDGVITTRGFNNTTEMSVAEKDIDVTDLTRMFIRRYGANDYMAGFYDASGVETILKDRVGLAFGGTSDIVVGLYSDIRAAGTVGIADNLAIVSVPTDPSVVQNQDGENNIDVQLQWNAASDPIGSMSGLNVDPDITAQYIFVGSWNDPNLYYKGATGDPGNTPASSFDLQDSIQNDSTYQWVIVEAMSGYEQSLTVDGSTLDDVDPHNIVGPTWTFDSLVSVPVITQQPDDVRASETDSSIVLTCEFTSIDAATALWYKADSTTALSTSGDILINTIDDGNGRYVSTLQILTPSLADEGGYHCKIDNGTSPVTSETVFLVIKKLLAQYNFDGTLAPAAGSMFDAPIGVGKSVDGLAEPNSLLASDISLNFVNGVDGQAVQINSNQYVDFGVEGYPKAYAVLSNGYGGGMDEGTIIFWVKPNTDTPQTVLGNFNDTATGMGFLAALQSDQDFDLLVRNEGTYLAAHVAGRSDRPEYDLLDGNWHLMAACWGNNSAAIYVDGQPVASNSDAIPASYESWQRGVLLGASRMSSNRDLLTDIFGGGAIDNLRIYNYRLDADSNDVFAQEYLDTTGIIPCLNTNFPGNEFNFDNTGASYCTVDLADFASFASAWLGSGLYVEY